MTIRASRHPHAARQALRWSGVTAFALAAALTVAGCTAGDLAQTGKAVGGGESDPTSLVGTIEPLGELVTPQEFPDGEEAGTVAAGEGLLTSDAHEETRLPRIHLTVASPDGDIAKRGETYKNKPNKDKRYECVDHSQGGATVGVHEPMVVEKVKAGGISRSCLEEKGDPELEVTYTLPGTTDLAWVYVKVPDWGDNILQCSIIDPKTWKTNTKSNWACDARWLQDGGHGWNPMPKVRFTDKKKLVVLEDSAEAQRILKEYCADGQPECKFKATTQEVVKPDESHWRLLSYFDNCSSSRTENGKHLWEDEVVHKQTDSLGFSAMVAGGKPHAVNLEVKAEYEHMWSAAYKYSAEIEQPVPWGWANWFYSQEAYLHIVGQFTVSTPTATYQINDADFHLPLNTSWTDEGGNVIEPQTTGALAYPVVCPNDELVPKAGAETLSDPQRDQVLQSNPPYVSGSPSPGADWLLAHGGVYTEIPAKP
jgi:hypothetical protein